MIIKLHNKRAFTRLLNRTACGLVLSVISTQGALASFLDTDFWCRTYGCVVVHDGDDYDIYDNWQFDLNRCCVPIGGVMQSFYGRAETPNVTGTLNPIDPPDRNESLMLGIFEGGITSGSFNDDGDGFLDAGDNMAAFTLSSATDIALSGPGREYSHSFFISSRNTRFSMRAMARIANSSGDFANTIQLGDIKLTPEITRRGQDGNFDFGARANAGNITILNGIDDLGDLSSGPTQIMDFGRQNGIRQRDGDIDEQSIRLDMIYTMPNYDLSMGVGSLDIELEFDFYRER